MKMRKCYLDNLGVMHGEYRNALRLGYGRCDCAVSSCLQGFRKGGLLSPQPSHVPKMNCNYCNILSLYHYFNEYMEK